MLSKVLALAKAGQQLSKSKIMSLLDETQHTTGAEWYVRAQERSREEKPAAKAHVPGVRCMGEMRATHWAPSN